MIQALQEENFILKSMLSRKWFGEKIPEFETNEKEDSK